MTIGEKITQRRLAAHLSQEILAERLGVSTQDVKASPIVPRLRHLRR